jgi:hypothetical protein
MDIPTGGTRGVNIELQLPDGTTFERSRPYAGSVGPFSAAAPFFFLNTMGGSKYLEDQAVQSAHIPSALAVAGQVYPVTSVDRDLFVLPQAIQGNPWGVIKLKNVGDTILSIGSAIYPLAGLGEWQVRGDVIRDTLYPGQVKSYNYIDANKFYADASYFVLRASTTTFGPDIASYGALQVLGTGVLTGGQLYDAAAPVLADCSSLGAAWVNVADWTLSNTYSSLIRLPSIALASGGPLTLSPYVFAGDSTFMLMTTATTIPKHGVASCGCVRMRLLPVKILRCVDGLAPPCRLPTISRDVLPVARHLGRYSMSA